MCLCRYCKYQGGHRCCCRCNARSGAAAKQAEAHSLTRRADSTYNDSMSASCRCGAKGPILVLIHCVTGQLVRMRPDGRA